jgi:outer membrane receptor protein involved in Fe transport
MRTPSRQIVPILMLCFAALQPSPVRAQGVGGGIKLLPGTPERITNIASVETGRIEGSVLDEAGKPLDGAVISALGGTTAFAVSDKAGHFTLKQLPPGPYLLRAHLQGFLAPRSTMVTVRPATRSASSFTLRREGTAGAPRISEASVGATAIDAPADGAPKAAGRDESDFAWRLRHLRRGVLREAETMAGIPQDQDWFITDSFEFLGRAVGTSAKAATALFSDLSLGGQVNLLTTGAFDNPLQLLQLDRTSSVAFFSVGAPVGSHGDWSVRAAMNQNDLSSWMLAGSYVVTAKVPHRYQVGMSYSLQRYEGGNTAAMMALSDTARNVGSVFAYDEWEVSRYLSVEYGANYAHYDYLQGPSLFSPRLSATIAPARNLRLRLSASRDVSAPGAEEFLPPTHAAYLPPQRTFSPISQAGLRTQEVQNYEVGIERLMNGMTLAVRAFDQRIDDQTVTVFGLRQTDSAPAALGHYFVAAAGDATVRGVGVTLTHAIAEHVRGSVDYSLAHANWHTRSEPIEYAVLTTWVPSAIRPETERIHDVTTSLQAEVPMTATRVTVVYKVNSAFVPAAAGALPGLNARFDLQVNQALPFMNFRASQWEMLVGVRNLFHESLANASAYDEILVVRPPKRIVGGLTIKF